MPRQPRKKGRQFSHGRLPPDDPIYTGGIVFSTPIWARPEYADLLKPKPESDDKAEED